MSTRAVTTDASAASAIDQALETGFLPDDPHYLLTGKFKDPADEKNEKNEKNENHDDEKKENAGRQDPSVKDDASAALKEKDENADTAAASAAAETQEKDKDKKGPAQSKTDKTSESRWAKVTRENKELREKNERLERERLAASQRDPKQVSPPAADEKKTQTPEPKIDDVDAKTGKAKYANWQEWQNDLRKWDRGEALRQFQETSTKTQRETALVQAKQTIAREFGKKVEVAKTKYPDFDAVALNPDLPIKEGSPVDVFTLDSAIGTDVLYYLGQNPGELDRINKLNPVAQVRELTKIEIKVSGEEKKTNPNPPARQVTQAARPPHQVSGKGTVVKDTVEQAVEDQDQDTYNREQTARQLARRRGK